MPPSRTAEPAAPAPHRPAPGRRALLGPAAVAAGVVACCAVVTAVDPSTRQLAPPCPLLTLTGVACPLCGATRGMHHLLTGQPMAALSSNLLLPVIVGLAVWAWLRWTLPRLRPGLRLPPRSVPPAVPVALLVVGLVFTVVRNLPFGPFPWLMP